MAQPFASVRESIPSLFEPVDVSFVTLHGIWFTHTDLVHFGGVFDEYLSLLGNHISRVGEKFNVEECLPHPLGKKTPCRFLRHRPSSRRKVNMHSLEPDMQGPKKVALT